MYGKIFESIYDGTIAVNWKAMITFQQMIVLCDSGGIIDMTPPALSRRTNIPIDIIQEGISYLELPDEYSRSQLEEGRRIIRIDENRNWGWQIVNHAYYRDLASREDKREKDRIRIADKRAQLVDNSEVSQPVATCRTESQMSPMQDARCKMQDVNKPLSSKLDQPAKDIIIYLNEKAGRDYKLVDSNLALVRARLKEGNTVEDLKRVVDTKIAEWSGNPEMEKYLRPATLFNALKFNQYIGEKKKQTPWSGGI